MAQNKSKFIGYLTIVALFCCPVFASCAASTGSAQPVTRANSTSATFIADNGGSTPTTMQTPASATSEATSTITSIPISTSSHQTPILTSKSTPLAPKPTPTHSLSVIPIAPTATPVPTSVPTPTLAPMPTPTPTATPTVVAAPTGVNGNPWGFDFNPGGNIYGHYIPGTFCDYFTCASTFWTIGTAYSYIVECQDGLFTRTGGMQGSCSGDGGEKATLHHHWW